MKIMKLQFLFNIDNGYILTTLSSLISDMKFRYPINFQDNFWGCIRKIS